MQTIAALSKDELQGMIKSLNMSMNIPDSKEDTMEVQSPLPTVTTLNPEGLPIPPVNSDEQDTPSVPMVDNSSEEAIITEFCECTGSDRTQARYLLEMVGFDLDSAIPLFFGPESPNHPPVQREAASDTADEPHPMNPGMVEHIDGGTSDLTGIHASIRQMMNNPTLRHHGFQSMMHDDGDGDSDGEYGQMGRRMPKVDKYDEDGIRLPDRAEHHQLVYGGYRGHSEEDILARADDPNVEWMFPPPRHLSYMGSLEQVMKLMLSLLY